MQQPHSQRKTKSWTYISFQADANDLTSSFYVYSVIKESHHSEDSETVRTRSSKVGKMIYLLIIWLEIDFKRLLMSQQSYFWQLCSRLSSARVLFK